MLAADGSEIGRIDGTRGGSPVQLHALPAYVPQAVLAAEDAGFYHHAGIDPAAIVRAAAASARGHPEGGSTITEQLAKLDYTGSRHTIVRKVEQALYALRLEHQFKKDEILQAYLNQVYLGDGTYGLGAASLDYFGVPPERLTVVQAATLAGMIRSPSSLDPRRRPDSVAHRRDEVLRAMAAHHWLSSDLLAAALATPVSAIPPSPGPPGHERRLIDFVKSEAMHMDVFGPTTAQRERRLAIGGYTIRTTFDPKAMAAAAFATTSRLGRPGDPSVAIASVQPGDGAIRALFGGVDASTEFDVASNGQRQPGSAFKPFVYLAALRQGIDPRSTFDSSSPMTLTWGGRPFNVVNYEGEGGGLMTVDDALVHSVNTVFAQLGLKVGPDRVLAAAQDLGIHSGIAAVPAVSLGGLDHGVSPLEMAAAYATFAAKGIYAQPYSIAGVLAPDGRQVFTHAPRVHQAMDPVQAGVLTATLERVISEGTGTAADIGRPGAGKTGTTSGNTDAWFVGYVPQLATAVWTGDPQGDRPMPLVRGRPLVGGSFPAMIFSDMMKATLAGVPVQDLFTASPDQLNLRSVAPPLPVMPSVPQDTSPTTATLPSSTLVTEPPTSTTLGRPTTVPTTTTPSTTPPTTSSPPTTAASPSG